MIIVMTELGLCVMSQSNLFGCYGNDNQTFVHTAPPDGTTPFWNVRQRSLGRIGCHETSVTNNMRCVTRSHLHHGGSLKIKHVLDSIKG